MTFKNFTPKKGVIQDIQVRKVMIIFVEVELYQSYLILTDGLI